MKKYMVPLGLVFLALGILGTLDASPQEFPSELKSQTPKELTQSYGALKATVSTQTQIIQSLAKDVADLSNRVEALEKRAQ